MATTDDWIRVSERKPMGPFAQIWAFWKDGTVSLSKKPADESWQHWCEVMESALVAWQPCEVPAPPKEQTPRQRDEAEFRKWCNSTELSRYPDVREQSFHAALAWERAEIAKMISGIDPVRWVGDPTYFVPSGTMDQLRARLRP